MHNTHDSLNASLRADALEEAVLRCKARINQDRARALLAAKRRAEVVMLLRLAAECRTSEKALTAAA